MENEDHETGDRRGYVIVAATLTSLAIGIPSYWAYIESAPLARMMFPEQAPPAPDPWVYAGMLVATVLGLYATGAIYGFFHQPPKSADEIIEDVTNDQ